MNDIIFDINKLNKNDRKLYELMTEKEKMDFSKNWVSLETQKIKLKQQQNAARQRVARNKKLESERLRRERAHILIERGAICNSLIQNAEEFSNDEIKRILTKALCSDFMKRYIGKMWEKHEKNKEEKKEDS